MRLLLDTHIFLWALRKPEKLKREDVRLLQNPKNRVFVSAASIWEISFLMEHRPNEINVKSTLNEFIWSGLRALDAEILPILPSHAQRHLEIQPVEGHSDLFDRMVLARAASEDRVLVRYDWQFPRYPMVRLAGR